MIERLITVIPVSYTHLQKIGFTATRPTSNQSVRECVIFPDKIFHQSKTAVFCPYFINGNAVRYQMCIRDSFQTVP